MTVNVESEDWFELLDESERTLDLAPGAVESVGFRIRFIKVGNQELQVSAHSMCLGCVMLAVPFVISEGWSDYASLSRTGWAAMLFLGVGCSGLAYFCWAYALERLQASRVASYLYVEPFVTQIAAAYILRESVGAIVPIGGMIVLGGVFLVQRRRGST